MRNNINILITSAGQRVSLVKAFQTELRKVFSNAKVWTVDLNPVLAPACHVSDGFEKITRVTDSNYISQLLEICRKYNVGIIIPTIDTELCVLAENKELFLENGIVPIISSFDFVKKCRDKREINKFFIEHGIEIPRNIDKNKPKFPLFIKPYDGSLSKDTFLINSKSDLTDYHYDNPKLMFMEYINPTENDEFTVDAYYNRKSELVCAVPRKRIFVRAGEINKGVTKKNELLKLLKEKLHYIRGATGCLTMQFFLNRETGRAVAIEINPRFGGGYPLSYFANANFPLLIIKEYLLNQTICEYNEDWKNNMLMMRYDAEILVENYAE